MPIILKGLKFVKNLNVFINLFIYSEKIFECLLCAKPLCMGYKNLHKTCVFPWSQVSNDITHVNNVFPKHINNNNT